MVKSVRITWCGREWFRWLIGCGVVGFWRLIYLMTVGGDLLRDRVSNIRFRIVVAVDEG